MLCCCLLQGLHSFEKEHRRIGITVEQCLEKLCLFTFIDDLNFADVFTRILDADIIIITKIRHNRISLGPMVSCPVIHIQCICMHWVGFCRRRGTALSMFHPNQVILHKTSVNQMRTDFFCILKYSNIFALDARTIYVLRLLFACMPPSGINKFTKLQMVRRV